jgi:hypothetical protein
MRIWTIHPSYLDSIGLVAAWREGLLAQKVLEGGTKGYTRHPQLQRFRESRQPLPLISKYLRELLLEAQGRGFRFDPSRIRHWDGACRERIPVNRGQALYELELLKSKLRLRAPERLPGLLAAAPIRLNAVFEPREGGIEAWERAIAGLSGRVNP